jgi:hypothetical protein
MNPNPLDSILEWYQAAYDSMRVVRRVIKQDAKGLVTDRHVFFNLSVKDSERRIEDSVRELQNVVVLALVAVFERILREHVVRVIQAALGGGGSARETILRELEHDVEYWNFSERLVDAFEMVPALDRGNVKQLIEFRNWVAHGHFLAKPAPVQAEPRRARDLLVAFLQSADITF